MSGYKSEIDVLTRINITGRESKHKYRKGDMGAIFVHQANSDLAAGLAMLGYKVIKADFNDVIQQAISTAKEADKNGVVAYIIDSITLDNGLQQSPFSAIGYIRIYDQKHAILALSHDTSAESVKAAFRYGASGYLTRPQKLDLIAAVLDGLIANSTVEYEAVSKLELMKKSKSLNKMIKMSDSVYLDYANKRMAFLDRDGVFMFTSDIADSTLSVLHVLATNMGKRFTSTTIARLFGSTEGEDLRKASDRITKSFRTIGSLLSKVDKYKTISISIMHKYGIMLTSKKADETAVEQWRIEKAKDEKLNKGEAKAGFSLVEMMEANNMVKTETDMEDLL